jgi:uncharacterized membrane protein (DUF2068 family)
MNYSDTRLLRLIAVFKVLKASALVAGGVVALRLIHADIGTVLERGVMKLGLDPGSALLNHAIQEACEIPQDRIWLLGALSFVYAGLFLTEGIGLWLTKRWGEWVTVIITGSLIPFEFYECLHRGSPIKIAVLLANIAIVVYLVWRIIHEQRQGNRKSSGECGDLARAHGTRDF